MSRTGCGGVRRRGDAGGAAGTGRAAFRESRTGAGAGGAAGAGAFGGAAGAGAFGGAAGAGAFGGAGDAGPSAGFGNATDLAGKGGGAGFLVGLSAMVIPPATAAPRQCRMTGTASSPKNIRMYFAWIGVTFLTAHTSSTWFGSMGRVASRSPASRGRRFPFR